MSQPTYTRLKAEVEIIEVNDLTPALKEELLENLSRGNQPTGQTNGDAKNWVRGVFTQEQVDVFVRWLESKGVRSKET